MKSYLLTARAQGQKNVTVGPTNKGINLWLHAADEAGMANSGMPTLEVETQDATGLNRRIVHVSLRDEDTRRDTPVLRIIGRAEPSLDRPDVDESKVDQPGVYLETHKGHWVRLADACAVLDHLVETQNPLLARSALGRR